MRHQLRNNIFRWLFFSASFFLGSAKASAIRVEDVGGSLGLGVAEPTTVVVNLISTALGLLGILAVIMILLGGFQWMLSAGDEEKIAKAKKTIGGTIVGLIIILLAWAIVNFVIRTVGNVTGAS